MKGLFEAFGPLSKSQQLLAKGNEYLSHAEIAEYVEADGRKLGVASRFP